VESTGKDSKDGKDIFREFFFGAVFSSVENHDFSAGFANNEIDEFEPKPCKTVFVGNHNCELIALHCSFQYGEQSFTFEIDAGTNVGNDFGVWKLLAHVPDLPCKIIFLLCGGNPAVADNCLFLWAPDERLEVEQSMIAGRSYRLDLPVIRVSPESLSTEP
jgi:hypothetical protein